MPVFVPHLLCNFINFLSQSLELDLHASNNLFRDLLSSTTAEKYSGNSNDFQKRLTIEKGRRIIHENVGK